MLFLAGSVRSRVANSLRHRFSTVVEAEDHFGIDHETDHVQPIVRESDPIVSVPNSLDVDAVVKAAGDMKSDELLSLTQKLYTMVLEKNKINHVPADFLEHTIAAMKKVANDKDINLVYKFPAIIAKERLSLKRMPWGLIKYNIDFFFCDHITQVAFSNDIFVICLTVCFQH